MTETGMPKENAAQEVADDLLTDPDRDAETTQPKPPQTIDAEPTGEGDGKD